MRKLLLFILLLSLVLGGTIAPIKYSNQQATCCEERVVNIPSVPDDKDDNAQGVI